MCLIKKEFNQWWNINKCISLSTASTSEIFVLYLCIYTFCYFKFPISYILLHRVFKCIQFLLAINSKKEKNVVIVEVYISVQKYTETVLYFINVLIVVLFIFNCLDLLHLLYTFMLSPKHNAYVSLTPSMQSFSCWFQ